MDNFETKLNEKVSDFFKEFEEELNKNSVGELELQPGDLYHVPTIIGLGGNQIAPGDLDAFALNPPVAGQIKDLIVKPKDVKTIIHRSLVGYAFAARLQKAENNKEIRQMLLPVLTHMLLTLQKDLGFDHSTIHKGIYATFKRPGPHTDNRYFSDVENSAAVELRLYSRCVPCIKLEGQ